MYRPFLATAKQAALAAEQVIRHYYLSNLAIDIKADRSPVTVADIETEKTIKEIILKNHPDHGFYGEETGSHNADAEFLWLIDPIDGTKSFVRQYPMFSTQIALMHRGELVVGVSNSPMFGELACAYHHGGAFLNDAPIHVSDIGSLADCALSSGNIASLAKSKSWQAYGELLPQLGRTRGYGDFFGYHLLAAGKIELIIESDVNILDIAALAVIVREAGGVFSDLSGQPLSLATTTVLAANSADLHQRILQKLAY